VSWVEVFAVFVVAHLAGDFVLQTEWQATRKRGGLGRDPEARRALVAHVLTYTLTFLPAFAWIGIADDLGARVLGIALLVAVPHFVQDDGRLVAAYVRRVKRAPAVDGPLLVAVDQSFHVLALFLVALLVGA
jgi:hypothetical protein